MENKENIDILIGKLQQHQPQLQNADELTDNIMKKIEANPRKKVPRFLSYIQTFSGVAAVLLGILFVFQFYQEEEKDTKSIPSQPVTIAKTSICLPCAHRGPWIPAPACHPAGSGWASGSGMRQCAPWWRIGARP